MPEKMDAAKAPATLPPVRPGEAAVPAARPPMQSPVPPRAPAPPAPVALAAPAQVPAAVSALDALAAGLAASNVSATAVPPGPLAESTAAGQPVRTLEDAIADMIKPMLQKWISDNMPRIIEKALRVEVGQPGKDGSKPPGT
jgi:cell pole-organizing protein PopZ